MSDDRFDKGAAQYGELLTSPLGRLRSELAVRQLRRLVRLTDVEVLDVGAGTGEIALRLAAEGANVTVLDPAKAMIEQAQRNAAAAPAAIRQRLRFVQSRLEDVAHAWSDARFQLVVGHCVLEYLEDEPTWDLLGRLVGPGGTVSVVVPNRHFVPLGLAIRGLCQRALDALGSPRTEPDMTFGIQRRVYEVDGLRSRAARAGLVISGMYGIRVAADFVPDVALEKDFGAILAFEDAAGAVSPYADVARFIHVVAMRDVRDDERTTVRRSLV